MTTSQWTRIPGPGMAMAPRGTARPQLGPPDQARPGAVRRAVRGRPHDAAASLRAALGRTRRLGRNASNGAIAVLALHEGRALVAILQETTCLTVLTWPQFLPRLAEFGRPRLPRKWGRTLRRLVDPPAESDGAHGRPRGGPIGGRDRGPLADFLARREQIGGRFAPVTAVAGGVLDPIPPGGSTGSSGGSSGGPRSWPSRSVSAP